MIAGNYIAGRRGDIPTTFSKDLTHLSESYTSWVDPQSLPASLSQSFSRRNKGSHGLIPLPMAASLSSTELKDTCSWSFFTLAESWYGSLSPAVSSSFSCIYKSSFFSCFVYIFFNSIYLSIYLSKILYIYTYSIAIHTSLSEAVWTKWFSSGNVGTNHIKKLGFVHTGLYGHFLNDVWTKKVMFCD